MDVKKLHQWCSIPLELLSGHPDMRCNLRIVKDSQSMGILMACELIEEIKKANAAGRSLRAIIPCGPKSWYQPFTKIVNENRVSLKNLFVFHMDECLDWQGNLLAKNDPYNFRTFMEINFYGNIDKTLEVPANQRYFLEPSSMEHIREVIWREPIDILLGGWGQDGHIAYNQARRHPFSQISIDQLKNSTIRMQENNLDTIIALGQRTYGSAYQFVPPMSITLGLKECLSAKKIRVFSDTGAWKQTALRVAIFSPPDVEYPMTLLQEHTDAIITATKETATHPISQNPDWTFSGVNV